MKKLPGINFFFQQQTELLQNRKRKKKKQMLPRVVIIQGKMSRNPQHAIRGHHIPNQTFPSLCSAQAETAGALAAYEPGEFLKIMTGRPRQKQWLDGSA